MFSVQIPKPVTRQRMVVLLIAAKKRGAEVENFFTRCDGVFYQQERGPIIQAYIDNVAVENAREWPRCIFHFEDDEAGVEFKLKYL